MSLNLYDVLDVDESASNDQIRAAWKSAIADLDPTDRRFRAFNDAAGVLLDADRRAEHDAELAARRADEAADTPSAADATEVSETAAAAETNAATVTLTKVEVAAPADGYVAEPAATEPATEETVSASPGGSRGPGVWSLLSAAVAAVLAVALAVWVLGQPDVKAKSDQVAGLSAADAGAEQLVADKIVPALSYDYRSLPANLKDLQQYMTPKMAAREKNSWGALSKQAKQQKAIVTSSSPMTGLTRISADGSQAVVVAFIDQHVRKAGTAAFDLKMWATFVLDKDASGTWLVDDICTDRVCS